jgi:predicted DCC family thiol-disulfide oxidoreductase YuxK
MSASSHAHLIFFDAHCALCRNAIKKIKGWDKKQLFSYASLDSDLASTFFEEHTYLKRIDSLILIEKFHSNNKRIWLRGRAVLRILWLLGGWRKIWGLFAYFPFAVDGIYKLIARHRHRFM